MYILRARTKTTRENSLKPYTERTIYYEIATASNFNEAKNSVLKNSNFISKDSIQGWDFEEISYATFAQLKANQMLIYKSIY